MVVLESLTAWAMKIHSCSRPQCRVSRTRRQNGTAEVTTANGNYVWLVRVDDEDRSVMFSVASTPEQKDAVLERIASSMYDGLAHFAGKRKSRSNLFFLTTENLPCVHAAPLARTHARTNEMKPISRFADYPNL